MAPKVYEKGEALKVGEKAVSHLILLHTPLMILLDLKDNILHIHIYTFTNEFILIEYNMLHLQ